MRTTAKVLLSSLSGHLLQDFIHELKSYNRLKQHNKQKNMKTLVNSVIRMVTLQDFFAISKVRTTFYSIVNRTTGHVPQELKFELVITLQDFVHMQTQKLERKRRIT